jgi:hypothetical protein
VDERTIFLYVRWRRVTSMRTLMVLSGLEETTMPWRTFGRPGPCSLPATVSRGGAVSLAALRFARWRSR